MKKFGLILLIIYITSLQTFAQWNTGSMLRMGQNAIYFDDYVSAIENFNGIIRVKPYLSEPYFFRGIAKQNLDDHEGAIQDFSKAIELNPNYFHAYLYRGVALSNLNKFESALEDYNLAISLDPTAAYAYAYRGMTKSALGKFKEAETDYSKAILLDEKLLPAYLNRAIVREKLEDTEGAMKDCNAAIHLNMFSDDAYGLRGYLYYQQKDYHNAIEDFNRALKANPENIRILMSRAMVWYDMKKYQETMNDYNEIIHQDSNYIFAYYNRAILRAEVGETNAAIQDLDKVVEMNPDNILIYFNRGILKMEIKDWYGAYDDFTESIQLYPDFAKAYLCKAMASDEIDRHDEAQKDRYTAMQIIERYKKMKSGDKNALVDTTINFQRLVDINARQDDIRDVINGRVQDKKVIVELQEIFHVQYLSLDSLRNGKVQYYNKHVMAYNQKHNYMPSITISNKDPMYPRDFAEKSIKRLNNAIKEKDNINDRFLRGCFYIDMKKFAEAIEDFTYIVEIDPHNLLSLFNLANAQMMMYDYIESIEDNSTKIIGEREDINRKIDYSKVKSGYDKCLGIDPTFVFALFNSANLYAKNGEIDKAIDIYTQVIRQDRDIAEAYFNRGLLYIYIGQKAQANADLSKAGELGIVSAYNIIKRYCKE